MSPNMWKLLKHQIWNTLYSSSWESDTKFIFPMASLSPLSHRSHLSMILSVSRFALSTSPHILDSGSSTISQVNVREDDTNDDAESCCLSLSCITWTWQLQSMRLWKSHCEEQWKWHWRAVMMTLVRMPVMMMMGVTALEMRAAETSAEC